MIARIGFAWVRWKSRHGLTERDDCYTDAKKDEALQLGVRGERYAYWYLRRLGYIFAARNYMPSSAKRGAGLHRLRWRISDARLACIARNEHRQREA
jgi:hypothetical protein